MKKVYYSLLLLIGCCWTACDNNDSVMAKGRDYIVGDWKVDQQTVRFTSDSTMMILTPTKDGAIDTMVAYYRFHPDSTPMQLDMHIFKGGMQGARLFGIVKQMSQDSFMVVSEMGFEGQAAKYRPTTFDSDRKVTYVRVQHIEN